MSPAAVRLGLSGPVVQVAPQLLGLHLVVAGITVLLTEVEAYAGQGEDPGSHAHRGRTPRTEVMFGPAGRAYVYLSYGMHWCLNVVTGVEGQAAAVLLRAGEVVEGLETARARRPGVADRDLCRGPARLTRTLAVTGAHRGVDLRDPASPVRLLVPPGVGDPARVRSGPRTGVAGDGALTPWRFWLEGEPTVSTYRRAASRSPVGRRVPSDEVPPGGCGTIVG